VIQRLGLNDQNYFVPCKILLMEYDRRTIIQFYVRFTSASSANVTVRDLSDVRWSMTYRPCLLMRGPNWESFLGDLQERSSGIRRKRGALCATAWFWAQIVISFWPSLISCLNVFRPRASGCDDIATIGKPGFRR